MKDLVSVIIPVYNVENYLNRCVESVINQTYKNLEIILIDDGSTDNSGEICDKLKKKDDRIIVIHKENGGLSSARNAGIDIAKGKYITFIDSDDFVDVSTIDKSIKKMKNNNADILVFNRYYYYENGNKLLRFKIIDKDLVMNSEQAIYEMNNYNNFDMSACCKIFNMNLFKEIRFPIGKISEDFYVMYLLFDNAKKIVYTSEPLYYYFQRNGSISKSAKLRYDFVDAAYQQMIYIEKKYPNLKACVHASYASANMTIYNILIMMGGKCTKEELMKLRDNVKCNYKYILQCDSWSFSKRVQAYLFINSIFLYNIVYKLFKKIQKV